MRNGCRHSAFKHRPYTGKSPLCANSNRQRLSPPLFLSCRHSHHNYSMQPPCRHRCGQPEQLPVQDRQPPDSLRRRMQSPVRRALHPHNGAFPYPFPSTLHFWRCPLRHAPRVLLKPLSGACSRPPVPHRHESERVCLWAATRKGQVMQRPVYRQPRTGAGDDYTGDVHLQLQRGAHAEQELPEMRDGYVLYRLALLSPRFPLFFASAISPCWPAFQSAASE